MRRQFRQVERVRMFRERVRREEGEEDMDFRGELTIAEVLPSSSGYRAGREKRGRFITAARNMVRLVRGSCSTMARKSTPSTQHLEPEVPKSSIARKKR